ncbi:hypothetical protein F5Y12DRAFT_791952 [Xylaria sp. FL1777]|nr:hypothetical protein F5Y12DRAFT_791952 [Xylaria sp. FL1777]
MQQRWGWTLDQHLMSRVGAKSVSRSREQPPHTTWIEPSGSGTASRRPGATAVVVVAASGRQWPSPVHYSGRTALNRPIPRLGGALFCRRQILAGEGIHTFCPAAVLPVANLGVPPPLQPTPQQYFLLIVRLDHLLAVPLAVSVARAWRHIPWSRPAGRIIHFILIILIILSAASCSPRLFFLFLFPIASTPITRPRS